MVSLSPKEWEQTLNFALQELQSRDFQQRWEVAKLFPKLGSGAIAPLIEILGDEETERETRWFVGRILSEFGTAESILALSKLLQDTEDEELSLMAAQSLANIGLSAITTLSELLQQEDTRLLAVKALSQIRRSQIIEPLLSVVNDPHPEIRAIAIESLGSFHNEQLIPVLLQALADKSAKVRKEAVRALGFILDHHLPIELVTHLKPLLYDFNMEVCQQAAIALGRIGTNEAAEVLFPVLKSPATPVWLKLQLVRSLSWIETEGALEYLQEGLRWSDGEVCQEIITVLGRKQVPNLRHKASQILLDFLNSEQQSLQQPKIKQALALSLGELGNSDALHFLQSLRQDTETSVKLHAIAALKKLES
jgi:HEAT repeat protein